MKKYRVDFICTKDRSSYFESDCRYEFRVVEVATGNVVMTFYRSEYQSAHACDDRGASSVTVDEDAMKVTVVNEDGTREVHKIS